MTLFCAAVPHCTTPYDTVQNIVSGSKQTSANFTEDFANLFTSIKTSCRDMEITKKHRDNSEANNHVDDGYNDNKTSQSPVRV